MPMKGISQEPTTGECPFLRIFDYLFKAQKFQQAGSWTGKSSETQSSWSNSRKAPDSLVGISAMTVSSKIPDEHGVAVGLLHDDRHRPPPAPACENSDATP